MLSCRELTEQTSDYLEGDKSFGARMMFRLHLAMCDGCRTFVRQIELVRDGLGVAPLTSPTLPDDARSDLIAGFEAQNRD